MVRAFLLLLIVPVFLSSQNIIRGTVTDAVTHQPLVGAVVHIPDLKTGTTTDADGRFLLRRIPQRPLLVRISLLGYASRILQAAGGDSATDHRVELQPSETELQEVVVTGVTSGVEQARNPVPTVMQNREGFLQTPSTNVIERLARIPGVSFIGTGSAIAKPVIRGLSYNRIVTLRDGLRQEGQQWGDEHGIEIDEFDIDHVEIIKGPGSIMFGSDAMAGVINNMTPKPAEEGQQIAEIQANYQTNAGLYGLSAMQSGTVNGFTWTGRVSHKRAGNFTTPADGAVLNSGFEEFNASGMAGIHDTWGFSHLQVSTFNQRLGLPEGERDSTGRFITARAVDASTVEEYAPSDDDLAGYRNSIGVPYQRINHHRVALLNSIYFGGAKLSIDASLQQNRRREFADVTAPGEEGLYFVQTTWNGDVRYSLPEYDHWNLSAGVSSQYQTNENRGIEFLIPAYAMTDAGGFLFAQWDAEPFLVSGGIRYDARHVRSDALWLDSAGHAAPAGPAATEQFAPFTRDFSTITGSLGMSYRFTEEFTSRVNLSSGFRAPNLAELGSNGRHEGTFRFEIGNPDLLPEQSRQFDLGLTYAAEHLSVDAGAFYNAIDHYIYPGKLSGTAGGDSIADPSDPAPVFKFTQGDAVLFGGEITVDVHPHPYDWIHFENSFSIVFGEQTGAPDSSKYLPFMPAPKWQTGLRLQGMTVGPFVNVYVKLDADHYFLQQNIYRAQGTETETPAATLLSLGAGGDWSGPENVVRCKVYLSATNLLDTRYQSHLSRLKYAPTNPITGRMGIDNPGRNISLRVVVPMQW